MTTISEEYRELNRKLHETNPAYGANGHRSAPVIMQVAREHMLQNVLDFGCGKGTLAPILRANGIDAYEYDPAVGGKDTPPAPADLVYCGDVAEHIEPEYLDPFLDELKRVTLRVLFLVVATRPAVKVLEDGRNAHLIQQPIEWWLPKLRERFNMISVQGNAGEFVFLGRAK